MRKEKSRVLQLVDAFIGVESEAYSADSGLVRTKKRIGGTLSRIFRSKILRAGGAMALGAMMIPLITDKILKLLGIGTEEEEPVELKEIQRELESEDEEDTVTGKITGKVREMMGMKEEPLPPSSISTPITTKFNVDAVEVVQPSKKVLGHIEEASKISGVDVGVLMAVSHQESKFKENARSGIGATGLFQITPKTWNYLVGKFGKKLGIKQGDINKPRANAIIGAMYIKNIISRLAKSLGHKPSITDIYAGYFLGPTGAKKLLKAVARNPDADATKMFPAAARYNKNVFRHPDGRPKTVEEVYRTIWGKVGLQYLKFSHQQGTTPSYGSVTSFDKPAPVRSSSSSSSKGESSAHPVDIKLGQGTTAAIPQDVDVSLPRSSVEESQVGTMTELEKEVREGLSYSVKPKDAPEVNFIRDKQGRLLTVQVQ